MTSYPAVHVFNTDFGEVIIPGEEVLNVRMKITGWPDRRYTAGSRFEKYLKYVNSLAEQAWSTGKGRLKIAPPYSAWLRANYG